MIRRWTESNGAASQAGLPFQRYPDIADACESQEDEPAEIFVLGPGSFYQSHLNSVQKLSSRPEVVLASGPKLPNLAKILVPHILYSDWSDEEIAWELRAAGEFYRRSRRLEALRDHHQRSWNPDSNPAINLVTNLMRKCTIAEDYRDLLAAVLGMKSVIDFHDASLMVVDGEGGLVEGWHASRESKDRLRPLSTSGALPGFLGGLAEGEVHNFTSSDGGPLSTDSLTSNPWSFAIALKFSQEHRLRSPRGKKSAILILYRRELVPFQERDFWLLEMTYGPLALALEKVTMLKAIGQASKEWRSTFDGISEPLTVIDSNYQIVKANLAFARLVGQDIKKLKTRRCYSLLAGRRTPCVGCPVGMEARSQAGTRIQWQGKNKKDLLVWSYGIRTGLDSYHFQFYRNVSKETMLTSALIQSEKMAALGRLVGAVAHEINNPLAGILATSQILLQEADDGEALDPSIREDLEEIRSAAWRSKKIIEDLLGFTDPAEKPLERADLLEVIRSTLTFSKAALQEASVKIECDEKHPEAMVSVNALQQVLFNLVTNAAQAMNGKGELTISLRREDGRFKIFVRDSGPGIPADKLKHIFDPFFTSKQEGVGTGLGLSIVRNLTQKMNGKIEVSSTPGRGTEFALTLPPGSGESG
jgi:two-component system, NtrC family, sensor kinase